MLFANAQDNKEIEALTQRLSAAKTDTDRAKVYNDLSVAYSDNDTIKAHIYVEKAFDIFTKYNNEHGIARTIFVKGVMMGNMSKSDSALYFYEKVLPMAEKLGDQVFVASILTNTGLMYNNEDDFPKAAEYYNKAITLCESTGNKNGMANATRKLANLYLHEDDFKKAIELFKKGYDLYLDLKDSASMAESLGSIGFASRYAGMPDTAIAYFNRAVTLFVKVRYVTFLPIAYTEIGRTYLEEKKYTDAIINFKKALELYKGIQYLSHQDALNIFTGRAYTELKQFDDAKKYLDTGLYIARETIDLEMEKEAIEAFYKFYLKQNDNTNALKYLQQYKELSDNLDKKQQLARITEMNTKYETEKKEKQIQQQQFEIGKRNYYIAGISTVLILASLLAVSFYRRHGLKQKAKLQAEILRQREMASKAIIEAEENERKRISRDLHDGVGQMMSAARMNLSAIEEAISFPSEEHRQNFYKVISLIDEGCNEVRAVSHNMMPNALLKAGLSSAVREFIDKIDSHIIKVALHAEGLNERIDSNIETVLYRVIQECVNNVIKHAHATTLDISLIKDADGISATIEDNGDGFDTGKINGFEGIGLKNIQSRINYLKGTVEWDSSVGKGTLVAIHVTI